MYRTLSAVVLMLAVTACAPTTRWQERADRPVEDEPRKDFADQPRYLYGCGINWADWQWPGNRTLWRRDGSCMKRIKEMGGTSVPINIPWFNVERKQSEWDFEYVDHQVELAEKHGLAMFAYTGLTPDWALPPEAPKNKSGIGFRFPPAEQYTEQFITYCRKVAERYKGRIQYYQFWNEPNGCSWIKNGCSNGGEYASYVKWLKIWYTAMKEVDPECVLAVGGLDYHEGVPGHLYVEGLYREGAKDYFDAIAIHPYGIETPIYYKAIEDTRRVMVEHGDGHKGIWLREYGWALEDEEEKSRRISQTLAEFSDPKYEYVTMAMYLILTDPGGNVPFGLCNGYLEPRPSFHAFKAAIERQRRSERKVVKRVIDIAPVWSGHPVGFALLTGGSRQYVAFYDADRRMTVAARKLDSDEWQFATLPERIGWDSHNYIQMAIDSDGFIHLSGNMHAVPLVYFKTTRPHDITCFERVTQMVGKNEDRVTYPRFMRGPDDELIFSYRDGGSGDGVEYLNRYDTTSRTWQRLLDTPLFDGEGKMNAYYRGPVRDSTGLYHVTWVWRDTPDCETNHDLSYARSRDLVHWENSQGETLALPITIDAGAVIDPIPIKAGLLNGNTRIGFDSRNRPIISYIKFDAQGNTQAYSARLEDGTWRFYQTSDWSYRWEPRGLGALAWEIILYPVRTGPGHSLMQSYRHVKEGFGIWKLDEETLKPIGRISTEAILPASVQKVQSDMPGMAVQTARDLAKRPAFQTQYVLRWETLDANRDRPREGTPPPPTLLQLYEIGTRW